LATASKATAVFLNRTAAPVGPKPQVSSILSHSIEAQPEQPGLLAREVAGQGSVAAHG
jgi:hypothetical protein